LFFNVVLFPRGASTRYGRKEALLQLLVLLGVELALFLLALLGCALLFGWRAPGMVIPFATLAVVGLNLLYFGTYLAHGSSFDHPVGWYAKNLFSPSQKDDHLAGLREARSHAKGGEAAAAYEIYRTLAGTRPEDLELLLEIAEFCKKQDRPKQARIWYQKALDLGIARVPSGRMILIREELRALEERQEE
jgi:hypothetical protein